MPVKPISARQTGELARLLEERGVGGDEFQSLFIEGIEEAMKKLRNGDKPSEPQAEFSTRTATETIPLSINYDEKVEKLVKAGEYGWSDDNITSKNFPVTQNGTVEKEAILVHFDRGIESDDVVKKLDEMGLRPADAHETLTFGTQFPKGLGVFPFPIVGLGAEVRLDGNRYVVYLADWGDERGASLGSWTAYWSAYDRFLAFRK